MLAIINRLIALGLLCCNLAQAEQAKHYIRGAILSFNHDPGMHADPASYDYLTDGVVVIDHGKIEQIIRWDHFKVQAGMQIQHYPQGLIMPGFVDLHVHPTQLDMIAAPSGGDLFTWLNKYTFPFEERLQDPKYATEVTEAFFQEL